MSDARQLSPLRKMEREKEMETERESGERERQREEEAQGGRGRRFLSLSLFTQVYSSQSDDLAQCDVRHASGTSSRRSI